MSRAPEAIRELEPALGLGQQSAYVQGVLGYAYAFGGQRENAEGMAQLLAEKRDPNSQASLAMVLIALGDTSRALASLESAARAHASFFTTVPLGEPLFDPVRGSPRFQNVLRTVGLQ